MTTKQSRTSVASALGAAGQRTSSTSSSKADQLKTCYNDEDLKEFDELIDQKIVVCKEQIDQFTSQMGELTEVSDKIKSLEDGLLSQESDRLSSLLGNQQKHLRALENAKLRIKNKTYGICVETGRLIPKARLLVVPHTTKSIEAKQSEPA